MPLDPHASRFVDLSMGDTSPLGKGPRRLSDAERGIAHALIRKGHSKRDAIRMARGLLKRAAATGTWAGRGKAHPQTVAKAGASIAQRAAFKGAHSLSETDSEVVDLSFTEALHPRSHGRFAPKGRSSSSTGRAKATPPTGTRRARVQRMREVTRKAQEEQARRIVARNGLRAGKPGTVRRGSGLAGETRSRMSPRMGLSSFSNDVGETDINLSHPAYRYRHGWIPINPSIRESGAGSAFTTGHLGTGSLDTASALTPERAASRASTHLGDVASNVRARRAADKVLANIKTHEPAVTADLRSTVAKLGGKMEALQDSPDHPDDFRFKTAGSMTRKIADKARAKGITEDQYASQIGDALRYTALFDRKEFVGKANQLIDEFKAKGYKVETVENTFAHQQAYSGVNMNLIAPSGVRWELQLHTPESIATKHFIHGHYDVYRDSKASEDARRKAYNAMLAANQKLTRPKGFETLGTQIHRPDKERFDRTQVKAVARQLDKSGLSAKFKKSTL